MKNGKNRLLYCEVRGTIAQVDDVLSGKNGRLWKRVIDKLVNQGAIQAFDWKVRGPIRLRFFESASVMGSSLNFYEGRRSGMRERYFFHLHETIAYIEKTGFPLKEEEVNFVFLTPEDLGYESPVPISQIMDCLSGLNLAPCHPADAARVFLYLLEAQKNHAMPLREKIHFLSEPVLMNLRGKDDPPRPMILELYIGSPDCGTIEDPTTLHWHWSEDRDGDGNYVQDMTIYPKERLALRVIS